MFILAGKIRTDTRSMRATMNFCHVNGREWTDETQCKNAEMHRVNGLYRYAKARNS